MREVSHSLPGQVAVVLGVSTGAGVFGSTRGGTEQDFRGGGEANCA